MGQKLNRNKAPSLLVSAALIIPVMIGLVIGVMLIVTFVIMFPLPLVKYPRDVDLVISVVTIPEGASLEDSGKNFEPATIKVVLGRNNTVRWVNEDAVPSSIVADNDSDTGFFNVTHGASGTAADESYLLPGESFEYTFTKAGVYSYHSEPHPWMHGTVVVFEETKQMPQKVDLDDPLVAYPCEYVVLNTNGSGTFYTCPHLSEINNIVFDLPSPVYKKVLCTGTYGCAHAYNYVEIVPPNLISEQQKQLVIDKIMNLPETKLNSGWTLADFIIHPRADRWFANVQLFLPGIKQLPPSQECGWYGSAGLDLETLEILDVSNIPPSSDVKC